MMKLTTEQMQILIEALLLVMGMVFTYIIKPYIDIRVDKADIEKIEYWTKVAIRCAEQIFTPEQWASKKTYVFNYIVIKAKELNIDISEVDINVLVEGLVNEIKKG